MAQKKLHVQNFEKAFEYTLFLGKHLPTFKCSSQNSTCVDTLVIKITLLLFILTKYHSWTKIADADILLIATSHPIFDSFTQSPCTTYYMPR